MTRDAYIIFLNGTSSAGKSTVADALREKLDGGVAACHPGCLFQDAPAEYAEKIIAAMAEPTAFQRIRADLARREADSPTSEERA